MKKSGIKIALDALNSVAETVGDCEAPEGTEQEEKDLYELRCLCGSIVKTIEWYENSCNNFDNVE